MQSGKDLKKIVDRVGELPAMPKIVAEVMELTDDPGVSISDMSVVIERDPALAAKILKVSNSSYYGMRQIVGTLKLALVVLGAREVRNVVLGIAVIESLNQGRMAWLERHQDFWGHSVAVAGMAKKLGSHFELRLQGEDFTAGLLHDIGKLVLWRQLEEEYEAVCSASPDFADGLCATEVKAFGFDHADVGAALAVQWGLPETLTDSIWYHHTREGFPLHKAKDPALAALVRVANYVSLDDWSSEDTASKRSCTDDEAWGILMGGKEPIEVEARRELVAGLWSELERAPALLL